MMGRRYKVGRSPNRLSKLIATNILLDADVAEEYEGDEEVVILRVDRRMWEEFWGFDNDARVLEGSAEDGEEYYRGL